MSQLDIATLFQIKSFDVVDAPLAQLKRWDLKPKLPAPKWQWRTWFWKLAWFRGHLAWFPVRAAL